jgi:hypothetical protein
VRYQSRDVFRVGSRCLPHSHAISDAQYSGTTQPAMPYIYGAFTLYGSRIPANFDFGESGRKDRPNTTFPRGGSVCPLPFSLAVTKGIAIAFSSSPY